MNDWIVPSHTLSGVLHGLFLLLAFLAPINPDLRHPLQNAMWERVAESRIVEVMPEPVSPAPRRAATNYGKAAGDQPGGGHGNAAGRGPKLQIEGDEPAEPKLKKAPTTLAEDVAGILAGFTDETIGSDAETALGELDDGGGGGPAFGVRGMGMGGGASCWGSWKHVRQKNGSVKRVVNKGKCPEAVRGLGGSGLGRIGGLVQARPDLGEKVGDCDGQACFEPIVIPGEPRGCDIEACPWKEIIGKVIRRHLREVESCYDDALRRHGGRFRSDVIASFRLPPEGGFAEVSLSDESGVARLDACITSRASRWIFPETGHNIVANYPFRFDAI